MAPAPAALSSLGSGSPSISPFAMAALGRRQQVDAVSPLRLSTKMSESGDFNGSCSSTEASNITPETPPGSCAAYFADVTDYCCAAVGGYYTNFTIDSASSEMDAAFNHPICVTSNYADMFSCYQFVTEEHCSGTTPVPFGVCNRNGNDTSNALQNSSASVPALATKTARLAALGIGALLTVSVLL